MDVLLKSAFIHFYCHSYFYVYFIRLCLSLYLKHSFESIFFFYVFILVMRNYFCLYNFKGLSKPKRIRLYLAFSISRALSLFSYLLVSLSVLFIKWTTFAINVKLLLTIAFVFKDNIRILLHVCIIFVFTVYIHTNARDYVHLKSSHFKFYSIRSSVYPHFKVFKIQWE